VRSKPNGYKLDVKMEGNKYTDLGRTFLEGLKVQYRDHKTVLTQVIATCCGNVNYTELTYDVGMTM
jgi:hypothetical protein